MSAAESAIVPVRPACCRRIEAVVRKHAGVIVAEIEREVGEIDVFGEHRRFVVCRMGATGSSWLAKLLNSHPDVWCSHEGVLTRVYPRTAADRDDILAFVRVLAQVTLHGAYLAAGDVGSAWLTHAAGLAGKFSTAMLLRHPARVLNSRLILSRTARFEFETPTFTRDCLRELWDIDVSLLPAVDCAFLHDAFIYASQVQALGRVDIIRIEELGDSDYCQEVLEKLTGLRYESASLAQAARQRVNRRAAEIASVREIVASFTPEQRCWYRSLLSDVAPALGYDAEQDVKTSAIA
jgi:hypothetical protein